MTHVSKKALPQKELDQLLKQFDKVIASLDNDSSGLFIDELLGNDEKLMLAKRFSAVVMFIESNSSYRVSQLLNISPSTAERLKLNYECGRYRNIQRIVSKNKKQYEDFWKILEVVLDAGFPPRGRGRWKSVLRK